VWWWGKVEIALFGRIRGCGGRVRPPRGDPAHAGVQRPLPGHHHGGLAGIYILLEGHFIWIIQVIGLCGRHHGPVPLVIMLLDIRREEVMWQDAIGGRSCWRMLSLVLLAEMLLAWGGLPAGRGRPPVPKGFGTTLYRGRLLFTDYLFPFEVTSVILLVGDGGGDGAGEEAVK